MAHQWSSCAALLLLLAAAAVAAQPGKQDQYPTHGLEYNIPAFEALEKLPGALQLNPPRASRSVRITQLPVTYKLQTATETVVEFTAPGYVADSAKRTPFMFAPTIRLNPGDNWSIKLTNALVQPASEDGMPMNASAWGFHGPMDTNLHRHGLHADTGVNDQATGTTYTTGDNSFVTIPARATPDDEPKSLVYFTNVPKDHLPGMAWYHPHKHGSTTIQTGTSHGIIIVQDHPKWLPGDSGSCGSMFAIFRTAPETILDFNLLFFKQFPIEPLRVENPTYQAVSAWSLPTNPLCCNGANDYAFKGTATEGEGRDILLVNGGYQPRITLLSDVWTRWRMLFSGAKGWFTVQVLDADTMQPAPQCELQLTNKDGLYLMDMPRRVPSLILAAGSRLELLVRCSDSAGKKLVLSATNSVDPYNPGGNPVFKDDVFRQVQEVLATIEVKSSQRGIYERRARQVYNNQYASVAGAQPFTYDIESESCTPLRPSYATDLRDEALVKAGYDPKTVDSYPVNFTPDGDGKGMFCAVNNQLYAFPDPNPLVMTLGRIVEWQFNAVRFHPMHVHVNPFQITAFNTSMLLPGTTLEPFYKVGDWVDNLLIPMLGDPLPFTQADDAIRLRFQPGVYTGYSLMHCHYLSHEDLGCMKVVLWKCPGYEDVQPVNGRCPGFEYPVKGAEYSM